MARSAEPDPFPVTPDDLGLAVRLSVALLRQADDGRWDVPAGPLTYTCWETVEHLCDTYFAYGTQVALDPPRTKGFIPFAWSAARDDGNEGLLRVPRAAGADPLLQAMAATGAMFLAVLRDAPPTRRAYHGQGTADPEGFAAMGVVETLVHTDDLAHGLELAWSPPEELCARVLDRLFPDAPTSEDSWSTLRWATGRIALPGAPQLVDWRWYSAPAAER